MKNRKLLRSRENVECEGYCMSGATFPRKIEASANVMQGLTSSNFQGKFFMSINKSAWMTDEEFAREMLAGVNPCVIQRLQQFPPQSKLDPKDYGDQTSTITKQHLEINMDGLSVEKAIQDERLFILDYHDAFLPYLDKQTGSKVLCNKDNLILERRWHFKAIELSLTKKKIG
ncbi:Lox2p [Trifolium repens]|nr:Lox2p [Trifolium repens]